MQRFSVEKLIYKKKYKEVAHIGEIRKVVIQEWECLLT